MPKWLKITIVVLFSFASLIALGFGGLYWWFSSHKTAIESSLTNRAEQCKKEIEVLPMRVTAEQCVSALLQECETGSSFTSLVCTRLKLKTCLTNSKPVKIFCQDIPDKTDILDTVKWTLSFCNQQGLSADSQCCQQVAKGVQDFCSDPASPFAEGDKNVDAKYINVLDRLNNPYLIGLKNRLQSEWNPIDIIKKAKSAGLLSGEKIETKVGIQISGSGTLVDVFTIQKSGLDEFDAEALRTVKALAPFEPPSQDLMSPEGMAYLMWPFKIFY